MTDLEWLARNVHEWPTEPGEIGNEMFAFFTPGQRKPVIVKAGNTTQFTNQQWLAKRAELVLVNNTVATPQWNGEGLPPVGCEVEVSTGWPIGKMQVVYVCEKMSEVCLSYNDGLCVRNVIDVSPLKTERQKAVEELASFLNDVVEEYESGRSIDAADYLYDQGYRKTN